RIYPVLLDLVRTLRPMVKNLARHDADLARQCRKALTSSSLNMAEGSYSRGKNRSVRYHTALGSLREVLACFEVAAALGYVPEIEPGLRGRRRWPRRQLGPAGHVSCNPRMLRPVSGYVPKGVGRVYQVTVFASISARSSDVAHPGFTG